MPSDDPGYKDRTGQVHKRRIEEAVHHAIPEDTDWSGITFAQVSTSCNDRRTGTIDKGQR